MADPVKDADYHRYAGCACITPNRAEAGRALGMRIATPEEGLEAARRLLDFGVAVGDRHAGPRRHGLGRPRRATPGCFPPGRGRCATSPGAGDMVLAALGYCWPPGPTTAAAIEMANLAGGLEVERLGVVPLTRREILAELARGAAADGQQDPLRSSSSNGELRPAAPGRAADRHDQRLLRPAAPGPRRLAAGGPQAGRLPGGGRSTATAACGSSRAPGRPIIDQQGRAEMLAALACVDYVVIFDDASVAGWWRGSCPTCWSRPTSTRVEQVVGHEIGDPSRRPAWCRCR